MPKSKVKSQKPNSIALSLHHDCSIYPSSSVHLAVDNTRRRVDYGGTVTTLVIPSTLPTLGLGTNSMCCAARWNPGQHQSLRPGTEHTCIDSPARCDDVRRPRLSGADHVCVCVICARSAARGYSGGGGRRRGGSGGGGGRVLVWYLVVVVVVVVSGR